MVGCAWHYARWQGKEVLDIGCAGLIRMDGWMESLLAVSVCTVIVCCAEFAVWQVAE